MRFRMTGVFVRIPVGMLVLALALLLALLGNCVTAIEGRSQTMAKHDADFYAQHDRLRSLILAECRRDPAAALQNGDCINASQAQILAAERDGLRHIQPIPMSRPQYWRTVPPADLWYHLKTCRSMTPREQAHNFCDVARRA